MDWEHFEPCIAQRIFDQTKNLLDLKGNDATLKDIVSEMNRIFEFDPTTTPNFRR